MIDADIERAIIEVIPSELRIYAHEVSKIITSVIDGTLNPEDARFLLLSNNNYLSVLSSLRETIVNTNSSIISFGEDNQIGDIKIQDVAKGNIVKIGTISFSNSNIPFQQLCYKCSAVNFPNTKHCARCGTMLIRPCPECGRETSLISSSICISCGAYYDYIVYKKTIQEELLTKEGEFQELSKRLTSANEYFRNRVPPAHSKFSNFFILLAWAYTVVSVILVLVFFIGGASNIILVVLLISSSFLGILMGIIGERVKSAERTIYRKTLEVFNKQTNKIQEQLYGMVNDQDRLRKEIDSLYRKYYITEEEFRRKNR